MSDLSELEASAAAFAAAEAALTDAQARRDRAIVAALDDGARVLEVQIRTGLSERRISQIRRAARETES